VVKPVVEKGSQRRLAWLQIRTALNGGDEAGAFDLCLALGAFEGMPFATPLPRLRIGNVKNYCPMAGGSLA
jgi:hypothetical protein